MQELITAYKVRRKDDTGDDGLIRIQFRRGSAFTPVNGRSIALGGNMSHNEKVRDGKFIRYPDDDRPIRVIIEEREQYLWDWRKPEGERRVELSREIMA